MKQATTLRTALFALLALLLITVGRRLARDAAEAPARTTAADATGPAPRHPSGPAAGPGGDAALAAKHGTKAREAEGKPEDGASFRMPEPLDGELPAVTRSQVRATVPAGHSMVAGGHLLADGTREFAVMTPKRMEGLKAIEIEVDLLNLDAAGVAAAGLETLVTGDRKTEQNAEVWTPEEVARTAGSMQGDARHAKPRVVTMPGSPARITTGADPARFELELQATETADGGFDLSSDMKRVE